MLKGKLCHRAEKAKKQHHGLLTIQYRVSFYNSFRENRFGLDTLGASVVDKRMGSKANDNKIDTKINKSTFAGSLKFNKNCPIPTNANVTIM